MAIVELDHFYPGKKDSRWGDYDITDFDVIAKGDEKAGSVSSLLVDDSSGKIQYFAIDNDGLLSSKTTLLPVGLGRTVYMDRRVYVEKLTKDQLQSLPEWNDQGSPNATYKEQMEESIQSSLEENGDIETQALEKEPYFYTLRDDTMKSIQAKLTAHAEQTVQ
jgi:hypothetical protein